MEKSLSHIAFTQDGQQEYYYQGGDVFRAPISTVFDVDTGNRQGRYEHTYARFMQAVKQGIYAPSLPATTVFPSLVTPKRADLVKFLMAHMSMDAGMATKVAARSIYREHHKQLAIDPVMMEALGRIERGMNEEAAVEIMMAQIEKREMAAPVNVIGGVKGSCSPAGAIPRTEDDPEDPENRKS